MDKFQVDDAGTLPVVNTENRICGLCVAAQNFTVLIREIMKDFSEE